MCGKAGSAKTFRQFNEIRVVQIGADHPAVKPLFLLTLYISKATVVKNDGYQAQLVLHCGGYFMNDKDNASVSAALANSHVHNASHNTQGSGVAEAQSTLIARADVLAWFVDRKTIPGREAYLCHLVNENAIAR